MSAPSFDPAFAGNSRPRILVIRRDNIGDLVLTTPLIAALRERYPHAWLGALVNSYNAPVLNNNPHLDAVFAYEKAKHHAWHARPGVYLNTAKLLLSLKRMKIDAALIASPNRQPQALKFARAIGAQHVLEPSPPPAEPVHEARAVFRLGAPFGIKGDPGPTQVFVATCKPVFPGTGPLIALHLSARRVSQRWAAEKFAQLACELHAAHGARVLLVWSPGAADDARHPGDDEKVQAVEAAIHEATKHEAARGRGAEGVAWLKPAPTKTLDALITVLAQAQLMVCADGGAMHIAAALKVPVVALFGDSPPERWHPWAVPHQVLRAPSHDVKDIAVEQVSAACDALLRA